MSNNLVLQAGLWLLIILGGAALPGVLRAGEVPFFQDDFSIQALRTAVNESLQYYRQIPASQAVTVCGRKYSPARMIDTLVTFSHLLAAGLSPEALDRRIKQEFLVCRAKGGAETGRMLVTGYFEPFYDARVEKMAPYLYPLYRVPADLAVDVGSSPADRKVGRLTSKGMVPYWTRSEIESGDLLAGSELVYLKDPVDAFILHVQGSGRVRLPDGSIRRVQFAAKNGRPYRSIGRLLVDEGIFTLEEVDLPKIVEYLKLNPSAQQRILHHNDSFVFFRWGEALENGPLGSLGRPLTAGRSVALDQSRYPAGGLAYLATSQPVFANDNRITAWRPLSRFVLNQDSGSAIKGGGRLDLFWGSSAEAERAAGVMKQPGELYFLVKKK